MCDESLHFLGILVCVLPSPFGMLFYKVMFGFTHAPSVFSVSTGHVWYIFHTYYMMNRCLWVALDYPPTCKRCNTQWGRCVAITYLISVVPRRCA